MQHEQIRGFALQFLPERAHPRQTADRPFLEALDPVDVVDGEQDRGAIP
mgnify:CR=1 FL=1